jgi:phage gp36-like protein
MSYATLQDLTDRAGDAEILDVADRDRDEVVDTEVVAAAIETADKRIDAALAVRFRTPLARVPEIVKGWSVSIARYVLHRDGAPEHVVRDYDQALSDLRDVVAGKLAVPDAEGLQPAQQTAIGATVSEGTPAVFAPENLGGWL